MKKSSFGLSNLEPVLKKPVKIKTRNLVLSKKSRSYFLAGGKVNDTWPKTWSKLPIDDAKNTNKIKNFIFGNYFFFTNLFFRDKKFLTDFSSRQDWSEPTEKFRTDRREFVFPKVIFSCWLQGCHPSQNLKEAMF